MLFLGYRTISSYAFLGVSAISCGQVWADEMTSAYTPTSGKACKIVSREKETGDATMRCPGVGGYSLLVIESDSRTSITVIAPDNQQLPLKFWDVVAPSFSTLGPRVEWRFLPRRGVPVPVGIIARVDTVDQIDVTRPKPLSFLAIARIHSGKACVTGKIAAGQANANRDARKVADAADRDCLPPIEVK